MKLQGLVLTAALAVATPAAAAPVVLGVTTVPGTDAAGTTVALGSLSDSDTISFTVSETPYLQPGPSYGTNAAGVVTVFGQSTGTPVGGALADTDEGLGFTYGALIATLNGTSVQVFATSVANGLGNAVSPPTTLTYTGTVGGLFGDGVALGTANTLNFRVDDSGYTDNAGGFVVDGAVPEPATWAMMMLGFGMVGFGLRYRRGAKAKVSFA
jgi:hypothetical protein